MEKNKEEEKNKKFSLTMKNKIIKEYQKLRNKTNTGDFLSKINSDNNYYKTFDKSSNNMNEESYNSFDKYKKNSKANYNELKNLKIQHLSKEKKDDYNNTLNKLFFTTSNIIKQRNNKEKRQLLINSYYNMNQNLDDTDEQNRILNKLFPDINEINKYSNVPFFSLNKIRTPFKMKLNLDIKKQKYKIKQEEFLYKISHENKSNENSNFNKNKGIRKGRTTQYFRGVDKFCMNNKISETNFPLKDKFQKDGIKLELDIENITKGGEKTSQMSNREKRIKMLENNVNNIKSIPNELVNNLEDEVFKLLDEEFDKNYNINDDVDKKNEIREEKEKNKENLETQGNKKEFEDKKVGDKININNLNLDFLSNYLSNTQVFYDNNYINPNTMKKPNKYPLNFYTTQQLRKKEHFPTNYKITFEERQKRLKKEKEQEQKEKNLYKIKGRLNLENMKDLKEKRGTNNKKAYKKQCKVRDILIMNKLKKNSYDEVDSKRILNGLKPWVYIKYDEKKEINLDILKQKLNEDIKDIL